MTMASDRAATLGGVPTAPGRLPLLGHLLPLTVRPLDFVTSLRRRGPVVRVFFGGRPVYLVTSPSLLRELLVTHGSDTDKGSVFAQGKAFLGEGLVTSAGELHRRQRRMIQPAFHRARMPRYGEEMSRRAARLADGLRPFQPVDLDDLMIRYAFDVTAATLFDDGLPPAVGEHLHRVLPLLIRGAILRAMVPPAASRLLPLVDLRYRRAATRTRALVEEALRWWDAAPHRRSGLIGLLREARDPATGARMPHDQLVDEVISIIVAGTETTGVSLSWIFYDLATNPDVERRVHEELRETVGDRPISYSDVAKLEYLSRVVNESLRLRGMWLSTRRALRPIRLGGVHVPAGTELAFSLYALHRDPEVFVDPGSYRVDRWSSAEAETRPRGCFIPFLDGNRKCLGDTFAWTELMLTVATVAARWRLRLVPGQRIRQVPVATVRPSRLTVVPEPRHDGAAATASSC